MEVIASRADECNEANKEKWHSKQYRELHSSEWNAACAAFMRLFVNAHPSLKKFEKPSVAKDDNRPDDSDGSGV